MDSHKTNVLTWGLFWASPMTAAIHLGPDSLTKSETTRTQNSRKFGVCSKLLGSWTGTFWRISECGMPGIFITIMNEINIGQWSSGQVGEGKSMCLRWFGSLCRTGERYFRSNRKRERSSWRSQEIFVVPWRSGTRRRTDWIRVENFPGFSSLSLLREIQNDLETKNIKPEDFKDRIIFMSMINDIVWKKNDENCISNALPGHWKFLGPGSEEKWHGDSHDQKDSGIAPPTRWYSDSKRLVILSSEVPVLRVVESWSKRRFHKIQNSCSEQFTLSISSVSTEQLRVGVTNSAWQKKKKDASLFLWTIKCWPWWSQKKWNCWYHFRPAPGNWIQWGALSFQILEKKEKLTQLCEKAFFQHLVIAGNYYKSQPNADDGWRRVTPLCREYSSSRSYPKTKALSAIPEGTIIGPVSEVHVVKKIDRYWKEVAIQSIANPEYTTYVVIHGEEERSVNEIHDHKHELRSSNELLAYLHESGRNEEGKVTRRHKETRAAPSTRETGADPVILTPRASLFTKRAIPTNENKWTIHAHWRKGGELAVSVSKLATTMLWHYDQDERQRNSSRHWESVKPVLMKAFAHKGARDFDDDFCYAWFMMAVLRNGSNIAKKNMGIYVISELFRDTLVVFQ